MEGREGKRIPLPSNSFSFFEDLREELARGSFCPSFMSVAEKRDEVRMGEVQYLAVGPTIVSQVNH